MENLDTEKLKEVLDMMVTSKAVFLKFGELIIEFNRNETEKGASTDAIGFEAQGNIIDNTEAQTKSIMVKLQEKSKPVGYSALFNGNYPKFAKPTVEGKYA
jgi:hypothetical protein